MAPEDENVDSDSEKREDRSESFKYDHISQFSKNFFAQPFNLPPKPVKVEDRKNVKKIKKKNIFEENSLDIFYNDEN